MENSERVSTWRNSSGVECISCAIYAHRDTEKKHERLHSCTFPVAGCEALDFSRLFIQSHSTATASFATSSPGVSLLLLPRRLLDPVVLVAPVPGSTRTQCRLDLRALDDHCNVITSATAIRLLQYALPLEELNGADKVGIGTV